MLLKHTVTDILNGKFKLHITHRNSKLWGLGNNVYSIQNYRPGDNYNFVFVWRKHFTTNFKYIDKLNFTFLCSFKQIMQSITLFNFNITDGGRGGIQVCLTCVVISSMLSDFTLYLTEYLL